MRLPTSDFIIESRLLCLRPRLSRYSISRPMVLRFVVVIPVAKRAYVRSRIHHKVRSLKLGPEVVGPSEDVPAAERQCFCTTRSRRCGLAQRPTASGGLGDLAGLEAAGAHVGPQGAAVLLDPDLLEVGIE